MQAQELTLEPRAYVEDPPIDGFLRIWLDRSGVLRARLGRGAVYRLIPDGGGGDMQKSVYDPQGAGYISGDTEGSNQGGLLSMDAGAAGIGGSVTTYGTDSGAGGSISTNGGSSPGANGGTISTNGSTESGGHIDTSSHVHAGGNIDTFGGADLDGGDINTSNGGGSIDTRGSGSIQLGAAGTRTTVVGSAAEGDKTITLPNRTGTIIVPGNSGSEGQVLKMISGVPTWSDP